VIEREALRTVRRHRFIRPCGDECSGLHVFKSPDAEPHTSAHSIDRDALMGAVGVQHVAFALLGEAAGIGLRERLTESGAESTTIGSVGPTGNTLFFDNNGLLLEATWPKP
jgi:hypothetical protein